MDDDPSHDLIIVPQKEWWFELGGDSPEPAQDGHMDPPDPAETYKWLFADDGRLLAVATPLGAEARFHADLHAAREATGAPQDLHMLAGTLSVGAEHATYQCHFAQELLSGPDRHPEILRLEQAIREWLRAGRPCVP